MQFHAETLNAAFEQYIRLFPDDSRLQAWLTEPTNEAGRQQASRVSIRAEMSATVKTTEDFLWAEPGGVDWSGDFASRLRQQLQSIHPWLQEPGLQSLERFSRWLCWHEGLNAPSEPGR